MKEFLAALRRAEQQLIPTISAALDEIAEVAKNHAKSTTLFKGAANSGIRAAIKVLNAGQLARTVLADKDYAGYIEYGNNQKGPYIYPVKAKALHFFANGSEIFAKKVRSHGPLPFMEDAKTYTIKKIPDIIAKHLKEIL
jgi:hypothetical protein